MDNIKKSLRNLIKNRFLLSMCFIGLFSAKMHGQDLNTYLMQAAENNPELKAQYNEYLSALEKVTQIGTLPDPQASFGYFISPAETRVGAQKARISLSQMFPWFGTLDAQKEATANMARMEFEQFQAIKNQLYFKLKGLWYRLYRLEQEISINKENLEILHSLEELALTKYESGQGSLVDVLRAQMQIRDLKNEIALLSDQKRPLVANFNLLLNRQADQGIYIPSEVNLKTIDDLDRVDSLKKNPQVKQLLAKQKALNNQLEAARLQGYPSLGIGADYVMVDKRTDMGVPETGLPDNGKDIFMPMISVRIPLYRSKYSAMKNEMNYALEAAKQETTSLENELIVAYEDNIKDYKDAQRRILLNKEQIEQAEQALNILTSSFTSAGKDFEELLRMQQSIIKYRLELIKAKADLNIAVASIDYLLAKEL